MENHYVHTLSETRVARYVFVIIFLSLHASANVRNYRIEALMRRFRNKYHGVVVVVVVVLENRHIYIYICTIEYNAAVNLPPADHSRNKRTIIIDKRTRPRRYFFFFYEKALRFRYTSLRSANHN